MYVIMVSLNLLLSRKRYLWCCLLLFLSKSLTSFQDIGFSSRGEVKIHFPSVILELIPIYFVCSINLRLLTFHLKRSDITDFIKIEI